MITISSLLLLCASLVHSAEPKPNVILIISDDYGFMGHPTVKTRHLDRMAAESLHCTRGYVMPVCSPTLASLLTG